MPYSLCWHNGTFLARKDFLQKRYCSKYVWFCGREVSSLAGRGLGLSNITITLEWHLYLQKLKLYPAYYAGRRLFPFRTFLSVFSVLKNLVCLGGVQEGRFMRKRMILVLATTTSGTCAVVILFLTYFFMLPPRSLQLFPHSVKKHTTRATHYYFKISMLTDSFAKVTKRDLLWPQTLHLAIITCKN